MNIPDSIWSTRLNQGMTLGERVKEKAPVVQPMKNPEAFINTWKIRYEDARRTQNKDLEFLATNLLIFLKEHASEEIVLLLWTDPRTAAVVASKSEAVFVVE